MAELQGKMVNALAQNPLQDNLNNLFNIGNVQKNLESIFNFGHASETIENMFGTSLLSSAKEVGESFVDHERLDQGMRLISSAVTANTYVVSDTLTLTASQLREGVDNAFGQIEILSKCTDINEMAQAQHTYAQALHDRLMERNSMNVSLMAGVLETNVSIAREAYAHVFNA